MDLSLANLLEVVYRSIIIMYVIFMIIFMIFEIYIRVTRTCYKNFAWNVIVNFVNISFLSIFYYRINNFFLSESIVAFLYIVLIFHFTRSFINELLLRYLKK
jgi:hypothetical protein